MITVTKVRWNPLKQLPALIWLKTYNKSTLHADAMAALIVTIMLIPQSLAYAMLAGLPPATGLYASILPLLAYSLFGSSRTLAVGPVAVISLLSANAVGLAHLTSGLDVLTLSMTLALLSGMLMLLMGFLKLGFIANLLGRPVVTGFITAAGILIALVPRIVTSLLSRLRIVIARFSLLAGRLEFIVLADTRPKQVRRGGPRRAAPPRRTGPSRPHCSPIPRTYLRYQQSKRN